MTELGNTSQFLSGQFSGGDSGVAHNRRFWDADADAYQALHGAALTANALAWGVWRTPEAGVDALGPVVGQTILELGCGAAQWSVALAAVGAQPVGLDVSRAQLTHAPTDAVPLVQASGELLPFATASFDIVFSDHGATSFCDPTRLVPEVARILRSGGRFAFCITNPLVYLTWDDARDKQTRTLHLDYDDIGGRVHLGDGTVDCVLSTGDWIALLVAHGFEIEAMIEVRARKGATTTYAGFVPTKWARRWPAEHIWKIRRR